MSKKRFTSEDIIVKLREAEIFLGQGLSVDMMLRRVHVNNCLNRHQAAIIPGNQKIL